MNFKKFLLYSTMLLMASLTLLSCNPIFDSQIYTNTQISSAYKHSGLGFTAFKTGFYQFAKSQNCVKCHDNAVSPYFGSANIDKAYEVALGNRIGSGEKLIDFNNTTSSIFAENAGNGHCGDLPCSNPEVTAQVKKLLEDWAQAELADSSGTTELPPPPSFKYLTASMQVPATVPTIFVAVPAVMRFNLSQLTPAVAGLENAILEIEIQKIGTTTYKVGKPKIVGSTREFLFVDMTLLIKNDPNPLEVGVEDSHFTTNWHTMNKLAPVVARPATLPVGPLTAVSLFDLPLYYEVTTTTANPADYFTIGIGDIK